MGSFGKLLADLVADKSCRPPVKFVSLGEQDVYRQGASHAPVDQAEVKVLAGMADVHKQDQAGQTSPLA